MRLVLLAGVVSIGCGGAPPATPDAGAPPAGIPIAIDLGRPSESPLRQGIVNGPQEYIDPTPATDRADAWISALRPTSWRFSGIQGLGYGGNIYKFVVDDYHYDTRFGTQTVLNLQDLFMARHGRPIEVSDACPPASTRCFASFDALLARWDSDATSFLSSGLGPRIAYFDPLGEADLNSFVGVTAEQRYELLAQAIRRVRELRPEAKVVGPSNAGFSQVVYDALVGFLVRDGLRIDAISWHELGTDPRVIDGHVATMRSIFAAYPAICDPTCPEIHINEYQGEDTVFIPGHAVGWLLHLESAAVDHATRACWGGDEGSPIPYESCWYGFSGMLTPDESSPQPLYWVYRFYAELGSSRFAVAGAPDGVAVIAGARAGGSLGILIGHHGAAGAASLRFAVNGFAHASARVSVHRIENTFNQVVALPAVGVHASIDAIASGGGVTFTVDGVAEGEAYWIVVEPVT